MSDGFCGKKTANLWTWAMVYRQYRYEIMSVHLCCTFGARGLHFYWHYYSKVFTVAFLSHCYDILSVYLCCTIGIAMLYLWYQDALLFWYRFFNLFTGNIKVNLVTKCSKIHLWGCEGRCEGREFTLTLTLTTETPINRAFQADCEGVRVRKKKFFRMKKECLPSHTIYYPKLTSWQVDEEMGLASWWGNGFGELMRKWVWRGSMRQYFYRFG